jgi:GTP pyrophosphokinase
MEALKSKTVLEVPWGTELDVVLAAYASHHDGAGSALVEKAWALAVAAHEGQHRKSGEPYITHPLSVAAHVARLGLDEASVAAALCHDTVEDCDTTLEDLERELGAEVARLVDGVTKLDKVRSSVDKSRQSADAKSATLRKLLVAVAADVRVLIIKLCDRLHNIGTINSLPEHKARRIAAETLEVYAPLAHRLGMSEVKWQLEDKSFAVLHPERYREIVALVASRSPERDRRLAGTVEEVRAALKEAGIEASVDGRAKHYWSIYSKMTRRNKEFDEIFDLLGIRVVVEEVRECYAVLGVLHAHFSPVPGRFKDYVARPKFNSYAALHSTVVGEDGRVMEIQIRTHDMHSRAEVGIAAHWSYKSGGVETTGNEPSWLTRLLELHAESDDPDTFLAGVKEDLAGGEVVCFTPDGDCLALPVGAGPLDFAYAIHTEVGHGTVGAKVNGRLVPLSTPLHTGDTVEVVTSKDHEPTPHADWLNLVVTPKARSRIRARLHREARDEALEAGRDEVARALRSDGLPSARTLAGPEMSTVASALHFPDVDSLLASVGAGRTEARVVVSRLKVLFDAGAGVRVVVPDAPPTRRQKRPRQTDQGIHAEGISDLAFRLAPCCSPVPGDQVLGYVTRGRGVSVHRTDCTNAQALLREQARCIDVEWTRPARGSYLVEIEVEGFDRTGLLADITRTITDMGASIHSCSVRTNADMVAHQRHEVELADSEHLDRLLRALKGVDGVYSARREGARA